MLDVLIAGAGPAGAIAALVLARAGARVVLVDRDDFPRDKLCGDTLNPGAVARLAALDLTGGPLASARRLTGMRVTGPGAAVEARYGPGVAALGVRRRDLDAWLVEEAVRAGARFEPGWTVRATLVDDRGPTPIVRGLVMAGRGPKGAECRMPAMMTIGADGRRSAVARAAGLVSGRVSPRRWAFGAYASAVADMTDLGEMHIRAGRYVGLAAMPDGVVNVCVVTGPRPDGRTPLDVIRRTIAREPALAKRFGAAAFDDRVRVLGPLAVDVPMPGAPGLLLAGDAAGFVDPMTGDGLRLAFDGAILAADAALVALARGEFGSAAAGLARARQTAFGTKLRFNRLLRGLVESPVAIRLADRGALVAPGIVRRAIAYAGDVR